MIAVIAVLDVSAVVAASRQSVADARRRVEVAIARLAIARQELLRLDPLAAAELEVMLWRELLGHGGVA